MHNNTLLALCLLFVTLLPGFAGLVNAQESKGNPKPVDVIIKVDGDILYGKVTELNTDNIRYLRAEMPDGPVVAILRKDIYAISYSNQTYEVITPLTGTGKTKSKGSKSEPPIVVSQPDETPATVEATCMTERPGIFSMSSEVTVSPVCVLSLSIRGIL